MSLGTNERVAVLETTVASHTDLISGKVSKVEFDPVRKIVYGMVALILTGFIATLVEIIMSAPKLTAVGG